MNPTAPNLLELSTQNDAIREPFFLRENRIHAGINFLSTRDHRPSSVQVVRMKTLVSSWLSVLEIRTSSCFQTYFSFPLCRKESEMLNLHNVHV